MSAQNISDLANQQQMLVAHNLRASHKIITKLERSKASIESAIARLPDAYFIIDEKGKILKGNETACKVLGRTPEELIFASISKLFQKETWNIFTTKMAALVQNFKSTQVGKSGDMSFELQVDGHDDHKAHYHWNLRIFDSISSRRGHLISVFGRDITEIREYEQQLSQIFSAIPLGIFSINKAGTILGPYSAYAEYLLEVDSLSNVNFFDVVFERARPFMSKTEQLGTFELREIFGQEAIWFDLSKKRFPSEIFYPSSSQERWLGLTYHPILVGDVIEKLLVVVDERTDIVKARKAQTLEKNKEHVMMQRIMDIQKCDLTALSDSFSDLSSLFEKTTQAIETMAPRQFCNILHGIKGVARTVGFSNLKDVVHEMEADLLEKIDAGQALDKKALKERQELLLAEWDELQKLHKMLNNSAAATNLSHRTQIRSILDSLNEVTNSISQASLDEVRRRISEIQKQATLLIAAPLSSLQNKLEMRAKATADQLGKAIKLTFRWGEAYIEQNRLAEVAEILTHLLNNAIDHGIETAEQRQTAAKKPEGHIHVVASVHADIHRIKFDFRDDGRGVDVAQVKKKAVEKGLVDQALAATMSDEEAMKLIFSPGFSTKSDVSDISGRGIGLDSVVDTINKLGGNGITVHNLPDGGSSFAFMIEFDGS